MTADEESDGGGFGAATDGWLSNSTRGIQGRKNGMNDKDRGLIAMLCVMAVVVLIGLFIGTAIEHDTKLDICLDAGWHGTTEIFNRSYCISISEDGTITGVRVSDNTPSKDGL